LMLGVAGVRMKPFMECRRGGHGIEQQDNTHEQRGEDRLAASREMTRNEPHNI
jgi:hypothetical protein